MTGSPEPTELLDDRDEFETSLSNFFWALQGTGKTYHNWNVVETLFHNRFTPEVVKEKAPKLFEHQKAFLNREWEGDLARGLQAEERKRKGQPKPRKTPLLSNTPRTTPEIVKQLPNRQHSDVGPSFPTATRVIGPSLLESELLLL